MDVFEHISELLGVFTFRFPCLHCNYIILFVLSGMALSQLIRLSVTGTLILSRVFAVFFSLCDCDL